MTHAQIADAYRMRHPDHAGGVIIIYGSHVAAWCENLPPASGWEPGCFAVVDDGREWVSVGGCPQDGAERWEVVEPDMCPKCKTPVDGTGYNQFGCWACGHPVDHGQAAKEG